MIQKIAALAILVIIHLLLPGCATAPTSEECGGVSCDTLVQDPFIDELYEKRTWRPADELDFDPVAFAIDYDIPIQHAHAKFLGVRSDQAITSLAAKIWMIDNARHTVDLTYYIFKPDLIGQAIGAALCEAVQRGVDVRLMLDSAGSISFSHTGMKALATCANNAGYMRNSQGELTTRKARVQVVVFNAVSKLFVRLNRRSHDKLLVVDGWFPEHAKVMTGGRNVSLSYYGINEDGSPNPDTYMDAEILLRAAPQDDETFSLGRLSEGYYNVLFLFGDNKQLHPSSTAEALGMYQDEKASAAQALAQLKGLPVVSEALAGMPEFMENDWRDAKVLLAHEMDNLTNKSIFSDAHQQLDDNPNSIIYLLRQLRESDQNARRVVSPYLFAAQHYDNEGRLVLDEARNIHEWLESNPDTILEIITNSVLTSDNFPAQSVIDMDMAPRLLLTEELREKWLADYEESEMNPELVESEEWRKLVNHPRLHIYETGRMDDRMLGGDVDYGKLHAKYIVMDDIGFVGTTNFDHRSRLINNEMGFFFRSQALADDLRSDFELLKSRSYRWGSPEWLEFRRRVFEAGGLKGATGKNQRGIYKSLRAVGMDKLL